MPYKEGNFTFYLLAEDETEVYDRGFVQNFQAIVRERLEALSLFEDEHFTIDKCFKSKLLSTSEQWKRPRDVDKRARFFVSEGSGKCSVKIGDEGSGWIAAAIGALAQNNNLLKIVVPKDQTLNPVGYAGIFHFRFWLYEKWIDVTVDDYLPVKGGEFLYVKPNERSEFWAPLLEKAYAKLNGSYEAIEGVRALAIWSALTGALQETYFITDSRNQGVFNTMLKSIDRGALICAAIKADARILDNRSPAEIQLGDVIYVSNVKEITFPQNLVPSNIPLGPHQFLRIRNFGSSQFYWEGPYGTTSAEWLAIPLEVKRQLGLVLDADRENWILLEDFVQVFNRVDIFHLGLDTLMDGDDGRKRWKSIGIHGSWTKGYKAGGNIKNNSFPYNPQYVIEYQRSSTVFSDEEDSSRNQILVELFHKQRMLKKNFLGISFHIFSMEELPEEELGSSFFKKAHLVGSSQLSYQGQVSGRFTCPYPGVYVIVPTTAKPNEEGSFFLRVFSNVQMTIREFGGQETAVKEAESITKVIASKKQMKDDRIRERKTIDGFKLYCDIHEELDCQSLQKILEKYFGEGGYSFSYETSMSLLSLFDEGTGKLGFFQLKELLVLLKLWTAHFRASDDGKGHVRPFEFHHVMQRAGFKLSDNLMRLMTIRYSKEGVVKFDDVIMCLAKIKLYHNAFLEHDPSGTGKIEISPEDWMHIVLTN